ncbi:hypothetical protein AGLY_000821 [Aphis glycines]|uniref:Uncharacterized protein n=1 Tax=Aphis glycines TaxID=307491 RepID=A0A6G0U826_APHGL|nr:hypothetical protein AGLY_000821 [Aphis glycines]
MNEKYIFKFQYKQDIITSGMVSNKSDLRCQNKIDEKREFLYESISTKYQSMVMVFNIGILYNLKSLRQIWRTLLFLLVNSQRHTAIMLHEVRPLKLKKVPILLSRYRSSQLVRFIVKEGENCMNSNRVQKLDMVTYDFSLADDYQEKHCPVNNNKFRASQSLLSNDKTTNKNSIRKILHQANSTGDG